MRTMTTGMLGRRGRGREARRGGDPKRRGRSPRAGGARALAGTSVVAGLLLSGCGTLGVLPRIGEQTEHVVRYDRAERHGSTLIVHATVGRTSELLGVTTPAARWSVVDLTRVAWTPFTPSPATVTLTLEAGPAPTLGPAPATAVPVFRSPRHPAAGSGEARQLCTVAVGHPLSLHVVELQTPLLTLVRQEPPGTCEVAGVWQPSRRVQAPTAWALRAVAAPVLLGLDVVTWPVQAVYGYGLMHMH